MQFFSTLANPVRLAVLHSLLRKEKNVTELVKDIKQERTLVSHNLAMLADVNLIGFRKKGKERIYHANEALVAPLFFLVQNYVCPRCSFRKTCKVLEGRGLSNLQVPLSKLKPCKRC